jgi:hypothetical protein
METESTPKSARRRWMVILIGTVLLLGIGLYFVKDRLIESESESLLIHSDAPCRVNVDGDDLILPKPGMVSVKVAAGQHLVSAVSLEENVVWEDLVYVENGKELPVTIRLAAKVAAAKQNKSSLRIE